MSMHPEEWSYMQQSGMVEPDDCEYEPPMRLDSSMGARRLARFLVPPGRAPLRQGTCALVPHAERFFRVVRDAVRYRLLRREPYDADEAVCEYVLFDRIGQSTTHSSKLVLWQFIKWAQERPGICAGCGCAVDRSEQYCGECMCEDDSDLY